MRGQRGWTQGCKAKADQGPQINIKPVGELDLRTAGRGKRPEACRTSFLRAPTEIGWRKFGSKYFAHFSMHSTCSCCIETSRMLQKIFKIVKEATIPIGSSVLDLLHTGS